jgi:hypothetical protein
MPLSDLPNEIILEIADHLRDRATNTLARTNYHIYNLLNGYLYRRDVTQPLCISSCCAGVCSLKTKPLLNTQLLLLAI